MSPPISAMVSKNQIVQPAPVENLEFITREEVAERLHQTEDRVKEKCRRRCPNPIPFHNIGGALLFHWPEIFSWVMNAPKVVHARHRRRSKKEIEAAKKVKIVKRAA